MVRCSRLAEYMSAPAESLILLWQPGMSPETEQRLGEGIRAQFLSMHASGGCRASDFTPESPVAPTP